MFFSDPCDRLSTPITSYPTDRSASARWDPRKPATPVIRATFLIMHIPSWFSRNRQVFARFDRQPVLARKPSDWHSCERHTQLSPTTGSPPYATPRDRRGEPACSNRLGVSRSIRSLCAVSRRERPENRLLFVRR